MICSSRAESTRRLGRSRFPAMLGVALLVRRNRATEVWRFPMCLPIWRHDQPSSCNSSILDRSSEEKAILLVGEALAAPLPVGPLAALRRACVVAGQEIYAARPDVASPAQWTGVTQICRVQRGQNGNETVDRRYRNAYVGEGQH